MDAPQSKNGKVERSNLTVAIACLAFFGTMVGVSFAAVPLYDLFCRVTGYGGTTQRVETLADRVLDRQVTVRFDANVSGGLPWEFRPVQSSVTLPIGEAVQVSYRAENVFRAPAGGRATFNVTPQRAGAYFMKMECFCFTDTELQPGETMDMPVVFYVDPAIEEVPELRNLKTITLSYTFYPIAQDRPVAAAREGGSEVEPEAAANTGG